MSNRLNVDRLMETLSDILSEKHGAEIKFKATPKTGRREEHGIHPDGRNE